MAKAGSHAVHRCYLFVEHHRVQQQHSALQLTASHFFAYSFRTQTRSIGLTWWNDLTLWMRVKMQMHDVRIRGVLPHSEDLEAEVRVVVMTLPLGNAEEAA